ncbi:hypothetical protein F4825DRAFT_458487 [Nemania diffusa]|nr:hypothetical protein F4825DRAFT_458487 [Nemania diffusa]
MKTTLEFKQFPSGASVKCKKAATWVRSEDAKFEVVDEINICQNPEKFDKEASNDSFPTPAVRST